MIEVYFSENAFWGMLVSTIESYKKETLGLLLGYKNETGFVVQHAIGYKTSASKYRGVSVTQRAHKKIEKFFDKLPHMDIIGDFHSHPQWGNIKGNVLLSTTDILEIYPDNVYVILQINDKAKRKYWDYHQGGKVLSGTIDDYFIKVVAWVWNNQLNRPEKARIRCPYALGFVWMEEVFRKDEVA